MIEATTETWAAAFKEKVIDPDSIEERVAQIRSVGRSIVTLNGSFDLMHAGHLHIIYEASQRGDVLIVALNSDASIKSYKDPHRPIITLEYRMQMMAAIGFVDYVTWFNETDPCRLLGVIKPDVHVNGAPYGTECIEADTVCSNGGKLCLVELIPGLSTTEITRKIKGN